MAQTIVIFLGSFGGGQLLNLTGKGFSENSQVTLCGEECVVVEFTTTTIKCLTPSMDFNISR